MNEGVQALLTGSIVDTTSALSTLDASQFALSEQLNNLSSTLALYEAQSNPVDVAPVLKQLRETKGRLDRVRGTIRTIESRLLQVKKEIIQKGLNTRAH